MILSISPDGDSKSKQAKHFYEKIFYTGDDTEFFEQLLGPIAALLKENTPQYPLTILYIPLRWCGFGFKYFERQLGNQQYHP